MSIHDHIWSQKGVSGTKYFQQKCFVLDTPSLCHHIRSVHASFHYFACFYIGEMPPKASNDIEKWLKQLKHMNSYWWK